VAVRSGVFAVVGLLGLGGEGEGGGPVLAYLRWRIKKYNVVEVNSIHNSGAHYSFVLKKS